MRSQCLPTTLAACLGDTRVRDKTAVVIPDGVWVSYEKLSAYVAHAQQIVLSSLKRSDVTNSGIISISMINSLECVVAFLATTLLGYVAAPLNSAYKKAEAEFYLRDANTCLVLLLSEAGGVRDGANSLGIPLAILDLNLADMNLGVQLWASADDSALLLHTSGTTGMPKVVVLTHRQILSSMENIISTYALNHRDRSYLVMPLFHVHGLIGVALSTFCSHGSVVIPPKFSASRFWHHIGTYACTWYSAVPTIHQIVLQQPPRSADHPLRFVRSCSSPLSPSTMQKLEKYFKVPIVEAYAMTEAAHQISSNPVLSDRQKKGSVGLPQGVSVAILDTNGDVCEEGEICVRGPNVITSYPNTPLANKKSFTRNGWFRTGDQGRFDSDGYLIITGRIKEIINRGGEKINPNEVDAVLYSHPFITSAASFAVPDFMYGQEVFAAVVLTPYNNATSSKDIKEFCAERLAAFKVPKKIFVVKELPTNATGKIQRHLVAGSLFGKSKL